jgi:hypothetical protein
MPCWHAVPVSFAAAIAMLKGNIFSYPPDILYTLPSWILVLLDTVSALLARSRLLRVWIKHLQLVK